MKRPDNLINASYIASGVRSEDRGSFLQRGDLGYIAKGLVVGALVLGPLFGFILFRDMKIAQRYEAKPTVTPTPTRIVEQHWQRMRRPADDLHELLLVKYDLAPEDLYPEEIVNLGSQRWVAGLQ